MNSSQELIVPSEGFPFKIFLFEGGDGNYRRERHWHRSVEIFAVCAGSLDFRIDEQVLHLGPDQFVIVNSNEIHSIDAPEPNETIVLQIPLPQFADYFSGEDFIWFTRDPAAEDPELMLQIRALWQVVSDRAYGYELQGKALFYRIMYRLVTGYRMAQVSEERVRGSRRREKLSVITEWMEEHYAEALSLSSVAGQFGYTPTYLSRFFRKYAGTTFKTYLQSVRLEHVLRDLQDTRGSITRAAEQSGFSDGRALARAFRKEYGMLPGEYLKKIRNGREKAK